MRRILSLLGLIVVAPLAFIALIPFVTVAALAVGTLRLYCGTRGEHQFPITEMSVNLIPLNSAVVKCKVCQKHPSEKEFGKLMHQVAATREGFLRFGQAMAEVTKSQEEKAVDRLIDETRVRGEED